MNKIQLFLILLLPIISCKNSSQSDNAINQVSSVVIANEFINAFYSFNRDSLASILTHAKESQPGIFFYQKWAECGNYEIIKKNDFIVKNDSLISCPITVKDDLIGSLHIDFNVTDTFHITVIEGQIKSVHTSSNDPDLYFEAKEWVRQNRPELIEKPCEGIWEGGPTPCECVQAMVNGFVQFMESTNQENQ
ncbi:MAG: hypothetical protein ABFS32_04940 [Bacteroidota bacterium]